jgi:tyrosyl-tRNA synthetase
MHALKQAGLTSSTSEAIRMIDQGGVRMDGQRVEDKNLFIPTGSKVVLQVGKRKFARVAARKG